jgi:hypothetical protein
VATVVDVVFDYATADVLNLTLLGVVQRELLLPSHPYNEQAFVCVAGGVERYVHIVQAL